MGHRTRRLTTPADLVVAFALTLATQAEIWAPGLVSGSPEVAGSRPGLAASSLLMTLPLAVRRSLPLPTVALVLGTMAGQQFLTTPTEGLSTLVASLVACHAAGAHTSGGRSLAGAALIAVTSPFIGEDTADHLFVAVVLGAAWLAGLLVGHRSAEVDQLAARNRDLTERLTEAAAALAAASSPHPAGSHLPELTGREVEVARAVAAGMTNAEIAAHLVISEWTVKTHVASILRKLRLRDRAQVVVAAYESGLVTPRPPRS